MAYDNRLIKANDELSTIAFEKGCDSEEFKEASDLWLEVFKVVAAERGESVIAWENPYDGIMELIFTSPDAERIANAIAEFKKMVDALASIDYSNLAEWKDNYDECVAEFAARKD